MTRFDRQDRSALLQTGIQFPQQRIVHRRMTTSPREIAGRSSAGASLIGQILVEVDDCPCRAAAAATHNHTVIPRERVTG